MTSTSIPVTTDTVDCPKCGGAGETPHPAYGSRGCPDPTVPCTLCDGDGEVPAGRAAEWAEAQSYSPYPADYVWPTPPADGEEPF